MSNRYRFVLLTIVLTIIFSLSGFGQSENGSSNSYKSKPTLGMNIIDTLFASTDSVTDISPVNAKLYGTVYTGSIHAYAQFEYGTTTSYGDTSDRWDLVNVFSNSSLQYWAVNLTQNTTYHYRIKLFAATTNDTVYGADQQFTTLIQYPELYYSYSSDADTDKLSIMTYLNTAHDNTKMWLSYGVLDSTNYVSDTLLITDSPNFQAYNITLNNLQPNTTYGITANVANDGGVVNGAQKYYFTTKASAYEYNINWNYYGSIFHLNDQKEQIQDYGPGASYGLAYNNVGIVPGVFGNARSFDDASQVILKSNSSVLNFSSNTFSLETWVKLFQRPTSEYILVSQGNVSDNSLRYGLTYTTANKLRFEVSDNGSTVFYVFSQDSIAYSEEWFHVGVVADLPNQTIKMYVNGKEVETQTVGTCPTSIANTGWHFALGQVSTLSPPPFQPSPGPAFALDEVRVWEGLHYPDEYKIMGRISGLKFWDRNNNHYYDSPEDTIVSNWQIILQRVPVVEGVNLYQPETTYTDGNGKYVFTALQDGNYIISEGSEAPWVQTYPAHGTHTITILNGNDVFDVDFGNTKGQIFVGTPGGLWSNPANWQAGVVPDDSTPVYLNTNVVFDVNGTYTIGSLRIDSGGTVTYDQDAGNLFISDRFEIEENGSFVFDGENNSNEVYCYGDFINKGIFEPGNSKFYLSGNNSKIIMNQSNSSASALSKRRASSSSFKTNHFYDLTVSGINDSTVGNLVVENRIDLFEALHLRSQDTLFVENPADNAIQHDGELPGGTVRRKLTTGSGAYRFESPDTYVQFDGASAVPTYLSVTAQANTHPDTTYGLKWKLIPSVVDTVNHTISATGLNHFSKWVAGKPGSGVSKRALTGDSIVVPRLARSYTIKASEEINFTANVQLRYDPNEIDPGYLAESELRLGRGVYYTDTVSAKWNMVSLPVMPDNSLLDSTFPGAVSSAYSFNNGYTSSSSLTFGTGYWLKFPAKQTVEILGDDLASKLIPVEQGWNMIGTITYPVDPDGVTLYPSGGGEVELNSFSFFGYQNGYQVADMLKPLHGYWVKVDNSGLLSLVGNTSNAKQSSLNYLESINGLNLVDASGNNQSLYFTFSNTVDTRRYELPPAPPTGILDARFGSGLMVESMSNQPTKVIPVSISSASFPCTVSWNVTEKTGSSTLLVDGNEIMMHGKGSMVISNPNATVSLQLSKSPSSEIPKKFALYQNYPNPFNPTTSVSFELASDVNVTLKIYNILGQEVFTAINNQMMNAGYHTYSLNSSLWASGVYFYKISAGTFTDIKKMVLTR